MSNAASPGATGPSSGNPNAQEEGLDGGRANAVIAKADALRDYFWSTEAVMNIRRPTPTFEPDNGVDFANGDQSALDAPGGGAAAAGFSEAIEFVHFGTIYKDARDRFTSPGAQPIDGTLNHHESVRPTAMRAMHYREALAREAILLAGFFRATKKAITYRFQGNSNASQAGGSGSGFGAVAGLMTGAADLVGGSTSKSILAEDEVEPFLKELNRIAEAIDAEEIAYETIHRAGIDLHVLRSSYERWLRTALARLDNSPPQKGMLGTIGDKLGAGSALGPLAGAAGAAGKALSGVAEKIAPIVSLVQNYATIVQDSFLHLALEYAVAMNPAIVTACRAMSVDAITRNAWPAFAVWHKPGPVVGAPPPPPPSARSGGIQGAIEDAVDDVRTTAEDVVTDVDNFLMRPVPRCPGGKFVAMAFQEPADANLEVRSVKLPELSARLVSAALRKHKIDPTGLGGVGTYVRDLLVEGSRVVVDFLHAVYGVSTGIQVGETIAKEQMLAAGRTHLLNKLIYLPLEKFGLLSPLRAIAPKFNGKAIVDAEQILARGLAKLHEVLGSSVGPKMDAILELTMKEVTDDLNAARAWAGPHFTMEAYLAALPTIYGKIVRHLVFGLVDLVLDLLAKQVLDPVLGSLGLPGVGKGGSPLGAANGLAGGPLGAVGKGAGLVGGEIDKLTQVVRDAKAKLDAADRVQKAAQQFLLKGMSTTDSEERRKAWQELGDSRAAFGKAKGAKTTKPGGDEAAAVPPAPDFPFRQRKKRGVGKVITDGELANVEALAKKKNAAWKSPADQASPASPGTKKERS